MDRLRYFGFPLKDISRLHSKNFECHSMALNLTLAQCKMLPRLQRNEGVSQVRLAHDPVSRAVVTDRRPSTG